MIASGLVVLALGLPWAILLPLDGAAAVIASAIALVAAAHGAGLVVARLAGQRDQTPLLVVQWGIAALIGLSGIAIALGIATLATHAVLVFGFVAVHTGMLGARFASYVERTQAALAGPRTWLVPAALLAGLGAIAVVGATGEALPRPFDDEGHVLAQLKRLLDTGTLGDAIGYPRKAQLGAQVALAAVATGAGDGLARVVEALALVLALGLAAARMGAREPAAALWAVLLIVACFALALAPTDPLPAWTAVGLIVALYTMLSEPEPAPALPLGLTAGALIALRHELAPLAAVAVIVAWWRRRGDHRRTAILVGSALAVIVPLLVVRAIAWGSVPELAEAQLPRVRQSALVLRVLLTAAIAVPATFLLRLVLPDSRAIRAAAPATALALAAIVAHAGGAGPYAMRLAWPIAIGFAIACVIELARSRWAGPSALIASLVLCVFIAEGREAPGRLRWSRRLVAAAGELAYLRRPIPGADPYAALLAGVPPGATVAVWINDPERLDYARHRIIDLRTPAVARLRVHRWEPHAGRLEPLLAGLSASYLLLEGDDARVQRTQSDLLYRFVCQAPLSIKSPGQPPAPPAICADDLEAIAGRHPVIARRDNLALVDLHR